MSDDLIAGAKWTLENAAGMTLENEEVRQLCDMADRIEDLEAEIKLLQDAVYIDDLTVTMMANDRITHHAKRWLNGPLPADLMADLADILDDEDYPPEKRAHQIVWQALKWMMENPVQKETHNDQR